MQTLTHKQIIGHALARGCAVWSLNEADRYVLAYFPSNPQSSAFQDVVNAAGAVAFPIEVFYSVCGCRDGVRVYF